MANPIRPRSLGDEYQARHYWLHALDLLDPESGICRVGFDINGIKAFDDVVVEYSTPKGQRSAQPLNKHCVQVKWQAHRDSRFGFKDLVDPDFINATTISLLHRLKAARREEDAADEIRYSLVTTARVADEDPLAELISTENGKLNLSRLSVGKTARSKFGQVRQFWKEALDLSSDDELYALLGGFSIVEGSGNSEALRSTVALKAKTFGITNIADSTSDFRFDSLGKELINCEIEFLDKANIKSFLQSQGVSFKQPPQNKLLHIGIKTFDRVTGSIASMPQETALNLAEEYEGRFLKPDVKWEDIYTAVRAFLLGHVKTSRHLKLSLDAHLTIAMMCGHILNHKSGVLTYLDQLGRTGEDLWHDGDDSTDQGEEISFAMSNVGKGKELAVAISLTRSTVEDVSKYALEENNNIGSILKCSLPETGQSIVKSGTHAARLADKVVDKINQSMGNDSTTRVHLFIAAPNAFSFFLGQHLAAIGTCCIYEFDLEVSKKYYCSIEI